MKPKGVNIAVTSSAESQYEIPPARDVLKGLRTSFLFFFLLLLSDVRQPLRLADWNTYEAVPVDQCVVEMAV